MAIPPEQIPRIIFLLRALEAVPSQTRIGKNGSVTFESVVRYIKRRNRKLYEQLLGVYGCDSEACLKMKMARTYHAWVTRLISLDEESLKAGVLYEKLQRIVEDKLPIRV